MIWKKFFVTQYLLTETINYRGLKKPEQINEGVLCYARQAPMVPRQYYKAYCSFPGLSTLFENRITPSSRAKLKKPLQLCRNDIMFSITKKTPLFFVGKGAYKPHDIYFVLWERIQQIVLCFIYSDREINMVTEKQRTAQKIMCSAPWMRCYRLERRRRR